MKRLNAFHLIFFTSLNFLFLLKFREVNMYVFCLSRTCQNRFNFRCFFITRSNQGMMLLTLHCQVVKVELLTLPA